MVQMLARGRPIAFGVSTLSDVQPIKNPPGVPESGFFMGAVLALSRRHASLSLAVACRLGHARFVSAHQPWTHSAAKTSRAALMVASMSASVCAAETKPASYSAGAR